MDTDKRNTRGRFGWVRRLVQGQNKPETPYMQSSRRDLIHNNSTVGGNLAASHVSQRTTDYSDDDCISAQSINVSTAPLKLIVSRGSTSASPSVLSGDNNHDNNSIVASTAETSIYPSTHVSLAPSLYGLVRIDRERERDSELIVTLASSSHRLRRRSIDTNCSLAGIPPASIIERLTVHPTPKGLEDGDNS